MNVQSMPILPLKIVSLFAAAFTVLVLAGCGSDTTASKARSDTSQAVSTASHPDSPGPGNVASSARKPCEYMARPDAEAAVGQPLSKTREDIATGECDYTTDDFSAGATLRVSDWNDISYGVTHLSKQKPVSISGVGDEALNLDIPNQGSDLFVRKGDRGFHLTLNGPHIDGLPDHGLEKEKVLAQKILPNF